MAEQPRPGRFSVLDNAQSERLRKLMLEKAHRRIDGLNLYRAMPQQQVFHDGPTREKLVRGSNRSGKTTAAAVEFARAVTGRDPRYPSKGIAYMVGKDGKELAQVMHKMVFRAGAFKMLRDRETNMWRAYNPLSEDDMARKKECKPAPPLIPPRMIRSVAWEEKKKDLPSIIVLHNGWEIHLFSSNALPPHGTQIDLAWFDEEILNQAWYSEIAARRVDRNGRFLWSATPQAGTPQLFELHERAEREALLPREQRLVEEFKITLADNIHLSQQQKEEFASTLSPDQVLVRIDGEFAAHSRRVYPEFSLDTHTCPYQAIPNDWTIYCSVDPGRQVCGVLFLAVPPPGTLRYCALFDELYIRNCSADLFGQRMKDKTRGLTLEAMIIDHHGARIHDAGSGLQVEAQYQEALVKYGVTCNRTGNSFTWGASDPKGGIEAVRGWLRSNGHMGPKLRVMLDPETAMQTRCPNFVYEMKRYWYKTMPDGTVTDEPMSRGPVHLCACIRYIIQDGPEWRPPASSKPRPSEAYRAAQALMEKARGTGGKAINFGPGSFTIGVGQ